MSPLSSERLIVSLAPGELSALRIQGRRQESLADQQQVAVDNPGPAPWTGALAALELLLDDPAWSRREMTLVLSSHFIHYVVLPRGKPLGEVEEQALARLVFRNTYGELANDWVLRVSPGGRQARLACGIPKALLAGLQASCEGRGTIVSVQPMLMTVYNRIRAKIDAPDGLLAFVEAGRVTLATLADNQWQSVHSRAIAGTALPRLLEETRSLTDQPTGGKVWLCDPLGLAEAPDDPAWQVERLSGASLWGTA